MGITNKFDLAKTYVAAALAAIVLSFYSNRGFAQNAKDELMSEVRLAWKSNIEKMRSVEACFEKIVETTKTKKKSSSEVRFSVLENRMLIRQQKLGDSMPSMEYFFNGETWIENRQKQKTVIIRKMDQMPAAYPFDFREAFMHDLRSSFLDCISRMSFLDSSAGDGSIVKATFIDNDQTRLSVDFDPKFAMLPTGSVHARLVDGNPLRKVEIRYEYLPQRDAYLPSLVVSRLYGGVRPLIGKEA